MSSQTNISLRIAQETKDQFDFLFEESGSNSKGEFLATLLTRYENPPRPKAIEKIVEVEKPVEVVKTVEVEKSIGDDQLLLTLSDPEFFALRETVLSSTDFAEKQNEIIDSLSPENKPLFGGRITHSPELYSLWVRNRPISKKMSEAAVNEAVRFNMGAFLRNAFLSSLIQERFDTLVTPEVLFEYMQKKGGTVGEEDYQ